MSNNPNELEVLLWSKNSRSFHIEKLEKTVQHGWSSFADNKDPDYIVVGVAATLGELQEIKQALTEARPDWDKTQEVEQDAP